MSDLEKKARIFSNTEGNQSSKLMREVEYDTGRYVGYLAGFKDCEKEYEEKLRWLPVEEKLPDIYCCEIAVRKQKYKKTEIKIFLHSGQFKQFCKNHGYTEWRYFL